MVAIIYEFNWKQYVSATTYKKLEQENKKLKAELERMNELLSNVGRCSEQYREKMVSIMEELKMFLYKD